MDGWWRITVAIEGADDLATFDVVGRDVAQRVIDKLRDRVEYVVAEPVEVYYGVAPVIREVMRRNGWLSLPRKNPEYMDQRLLDAENEWHGTEAYPEVIR